MFQFGDSGGLADPRELSEVVSLVAEHFFKRILQSATALFEQIKARGSRFIYMTPYDFRLVRQGGTGGTYVFSVCFHNSHMRKVLLYPS